MIPDKGVVRGVAELTEVTCWRASLAGCETATTESPGTDDNSLEFEDGLEVVAGGKTTRGAATGSSSVRNGGGADCCCRV